MIHCPTCPHFDDGFGSAPCLSCDKAKDEAIFKDSELPRQGLLAHAMRLDKEHIENLNGSVSLSARSIYKILPLINERYATMLLQHHLLNMSYADIAKYHSISRTRVHQLIQKALSEIRGLWRK